MIHLLLSLLSVVCSVGSKTFSFVVFFDDSNQCCEFSSPGNMVRYRLHLQDSNTLVDWDCESSVDRAVYSRKVYEVGWCVLW